MGAHLHELLHVAAATLFAVGALIALADYSALRERVVLSYAGMCLLSAVYAIYVAISHNLPKQGAFWIPWTLFGLVATFGSTTLYLLTMKLFLGLKGWVSGTILLAQGSLTIATVLDLAGYAVRGRSAILSPIRRPDISPHQHALGEGAYTPTAVGEAFIAIFALGFVFVTLYLLVHLVRRRSRDVLLYAGLVSSSLIIVNEAMVAASLYAGVYLMAFTKAFEAVRIFGDIRKRAREGILRRLRQLEKVEAIGRIASGIAHDFNNLLTAIRGRLDLLAFSVPDEASAQEDLAGAVEAVSAGQEVVQQLLDVVRSESVTPEDIDVADFLASSKRLLSMMVPRNVELVVTTCPDVGVVRLARPQLVQVLMNLVVNAGHAMPDGGVIEIAATAVPSAGAAPGPAVHITVKDEGLGIPEAVLTHIFEPLFTTKAAEGGSGLGLATISTIVRGAGGHIDVVSRVGEGTVFDVVLPRADAAAS